ncbi:hypothetical protein F4604DRAFT_1910545 [Suillus subluteus]|nr:hypothetical protein F4604DRAFT_1910545 [Suillus subluteus]
MAPTYGFLPGDHYGVRILRTTVKLRPWVAFKPHEGHVKVPPLPFKPRSDGLLGPARGGQLLRGHRRKVAVELRQPISEKGPGGRSQNEVNHLVPCARNGFSKGRIRATWGFCSAKQTIFQWALAALHFPTLFSSMIPLDAMIDTYQEFAWEHTQLKTPPTHEALVLANPQASCETWELIEKLDEEIELLPGKTSQDVTMLVEVKKQRAWRGPSNSFKSSSHLIPQESPEELARVMADFLQEIWKSKLYNCVYEWQPLRPIYQWDEYLFVEALGSITWSMAWVFSRHRKDAERKTNH